MLHGFSRTAHRAWSAMMTRTGEWTCDLSVRAVAEAQRSRHIAEGAYPPGDRRRAIGQFIAARKFLFGAVGAVAVTIGAAVVNKTDIAGVALFVSIVFGALEFDAWGRG